jgi:hypothetical protein
MGHGLLDTQNFACSEHKDRSLKYSEISPGSPSYSSRPSMKKHIFNTGFADSINRLKAACSCDKDQLMSPIWRSWAANSEYCFHCSGKTVGIRALVVFNTSKSKERRSPSWDRCSGTPLFQKKNAATTNLERLDHRCRLYRVKWFCQMNLIRVDFPDAAFP